jgi:hypothetical protein
MLILGIVKTTKIHSVVGNKAFLKKQKKAVSTVATASGREEVFTTRQTAYKG